jgi:hypothetical protein
MCGSRSAANGGCLRSRASYIDNLNMRSDMQETAEGYQIRSRQSCTAGLFSVFLSGFCRRMGPEPAALERKAFPIHQLFRLSSSTLRITAGEIWPPYCRIAVFFLRMPHRRKRSSSQRAARAGFNICRSKKLLKDQVHSDVLYFFADCISHSDRPRSQAEACC